MISKPRYIVLTDIFDGFEVDDIQSMIRLLLYANEIDIEGLICCTSCFVKGDTPNREAIIHRLIDAYEKVLPNLCVHADDWPSAEYLHSVTSSGIDAYGLCPGIGFCSDRYQDNPGVRLMIDVLRKKDERPLHVGLWGGANTLAQAVWQIEKTYPEEIDRILKHLRIYGISDQDHASRWLRNRYGDRLFWIVSPSRGSWFGNLTYWKATWPGISSDLAKHGSEDGRRKTLGFTGGDPSLIDHDWIEKNLRSVGPLGALYPFPKYIVEGDTPTFLWLIPNGLNDPAHPEFGGWGGRYEYRRPKRKEFGVPERHLIYTNASDTVVGTDGKPHTSPQATIWRWRESFQNDFAARMLWTVTDRYDDVSHPPKVKAEQNGLKIEASAPGCVTRYFVYPEAGTFTGTAEVDENGQVTLIGGKKGETVHVIAAVTTEQFPRITRYRRFVLENNDIQ